MRALVRIARVLVHVLSGLWTIRRQFARLNPVQRQRQVQAWSQRMLQLMGIELRVLGQPPVAGPLLVVANHISWLDIVVMNAACPARFVSKADVKHWPLLGALITGAGTLYIERESRRDAMRVVHHMTEALRSGDVLAVFPEGTTGDGQALLPFHANLLQAALSAPAPVQPVALSYIDVATGARSDDPVYVGDTTLLSSMWRTLGGRPLAAVVRYGDIQDAQGRGRRGWSADLRQTIASLLVLPGSRMDAPPPAQWQGNAPTGEV